MRLFSEKVNHTFTSSPFNIIQVENFEEIFFGIYEVEINKSKYPVEKISEYKGNPVVSVPILVEGEEVFYPFVLSKGKFNIIFNEDNTTFQPLPSNQFNLITESKEEETYTKSESKQEILEQIEEAKILAEQYAKNIKKQKIQEASSEIEHRENLLKETLSEARTSLVNEFVSISDKIKNELFDFNIEHSAIIDESLNDKISNLSKELSKSIKKDFSNSTEQFDKKLKQIVREMYSTLVEPKVDKELHFIAEDIVTKVEKIEETLDSKLKNKADASIIEKVEREILAVQSANIELNDSINKGINKALSRVGNVKTQLDQFSEQFLQDLDYKIQESEEKISDYYSEKIKTLEDKTFDLTEESRKYFVSLIGESRDNLLSEIKKLKTEKPIEYIIESKSGKPAKLDIDSFNKQYDKKLKDMMADEVVNLRKYIAVYSGGGSVATQYANGGSMNGNLNVTGQFLSAGVDLATIFSGGGGGGPYTLVDATSSIQPIRGFNTASGCYSTIAGGSTNSASATYAIVAGGQYNTANSYFSTVVGGLSSTASGCYSFIGGGRNNTASGCYMPTVVGGENNSALGRHSFIGGGGDNTVCDFSGVVGGNGNTASGSYSFIGGGSYNTALSADYSSVVGGCNNTVSSFYSGILGGQNNLVTHTDSFVIGSNLSSTAVCTTYMNNATVVGLISTIGGTSDDWNNISTSYRSASSTFATQINGTTNQISVTATGNTYKIGLPNSITTPGDVNILGSLYISGSSLQVAASSMSVSDPLIYLGTGTSGNVVDLGFVGHFTQSFYQHTGLARRAATGNWVLFSGVTAEPADNNLIDVTGPTFKIDTLQANIIGNVTGNADTVTNGAYKNINNNFAANQTVVGNISASSSIYTNTDFEAINTANGLILKSPNGSRWRITVNNSGALTTTSI